MASLLSLPVQKLGTFFFSMLCLGALMDNWCCGLNEENDALNLIFLCGFLWVFFVENNASCDYLDICGEPEFMERMEVKFHEKAMETGSLVVSACGFDSVPAELGWMFNSKQWVGPAAPNQIEAYLSLESEKRIVGNFGTYESAVLGVANAEQLVELRRSRPKRARPAVRTLLFLSYGFLLKKANQKFRSIPLTVNIIIY